jgi:tetratricopeptide (TPR) repeat protein
MARRILGLIVLLGCGAGGWRTVRLARAARLAGGGTVEGLREAIALEPGNARYYEMLASRGGSEALLDEALARNPRAAAVWIEKGLRLEERGERLRAEACYLAAAETDRGWLPAWTLANYYVRAGGERAQEQFWKWARTAAAIRYANLAPLFALSLRAPGVAGAEIPEKLALTGEGVRQYLAYLVRAGRLDAAPAALERVAAAPQPGDLALLLDCADRAIAEGGEAEARAVRAALSRAGLVAGPDGGIQNGDFSRPPAGRGFDWRWPAPEEAAVLTHQPGALRVTLTGRQAEAVDLLEQAVLLEGRAYRFRFEGSGLPPGVGWRLDDRPIGNGEIVEAPGLHRLILGYRRPAGRTRAEATFTLRRVALEREP